MTETLQHPLIAFTSPAAVLETAGGKGANLARLVRAGFSVPRGFIIPTEAYRAFVAENRLEKAIQPVLAGLTAENSLGLEAASRSIRASFSAEEIPADLKQAILSAYRMEFDGGSVPVAVRSSATAEDLPDLSFAGQQDTFLNVLGEEQLLRAVIDCWSSLWTARAIGYRLRSAVDQSETAIAVIVQEMLAAGREFSDAGTVQRPEDLFFLRMTELEALARGEEQDWQGLIAARRAVYEREQRRRQTPRVLVSDGRAFYEGYGADNETAGIILGSPVSPGVAEGPVRVVLNPAETRLLPGEILVCPGTDPAWTPLFMAAAGLITEVGGLMTHGSVIAREYGIPAVVGVDQATLRLKDGQRIRLDGSQGIITLLDQQPS